jgi:hypothetical protein
METVKHQGGFDVLSGIVSIGNIGSFHRQVERAGASVASPPLRGIEHRVIKETTKSTKGVLVTYIPPMPGDPIQSLEDGQFYIRAGEELVRMPYETLKRMFRQCLL